MNINKINSINSNTLEKVKNKNAIPVLDKFYGFYEAELNPFSTATLFSAGDDPRCDDLLYFNSFEPTSMELAYHLATTSDYFFDVGAHTGMYSLGVAKSSNNLKIIAFEPNPIAFSRLVMHIGINELDKIITPINFAVGNNNRSIAKLSWMSSKTFGWLSSGTKIDIKSDSPLRLDQSISPVFTLDQVKTKIGSKYLVKIDVEGFELDVFNGAQKFLKTRPDIILESFSNSNTLLIEELLDKNYRFFKIIESEKRLIETVKLEPADINTGSFNSLLTCNSLEIIHKLTSHGFIIETTN